MFQILMMAHEEKYSKTSCLRLQNTTAKPEKKGKLIWNIFVLQNGSVCETHPALYIYTYIYIGRIFEVTLV